MIAAILKRRKLTKRWNEASSCRDLRGLYRWRLYVQRLRINVFASLAGHQSVPRLPVPGIQGKAIQRPE
jgi:hypothetical protein